MLAKELKAGMTVVLPVEMRPFGYTDLKVHRIVSAMHDEEITLLSVQWGYENPRTVSIPNRRPMATDMSFPY